LNGLRIQLGKHFTGQATEIGQINTDFGRAGFEVCAYLQKFQSAAGLPAGGLAPLSLPGRQR